MELWAPTPDLEKLAVEKEQSNILSMVLKISYAGLGYYQYHAVPGNTGQLRVFMYRVRWLWRSVLIRRSQRAGVRWARLHPLLNRWIPQPRVQHPYPDARFAAMHPK